MKMQLTSAIFHMSFLYGHVAIYVPKDEKVRISKYVVIRLQCLYSLLMCHSFGIAQMDPHAVTGMERILKGYLVHPFISKSD